MKVLYLTLKKAPFEVMVTGEKNFEIREKGKWINSRLFWPNGSNRHYDAVKFTNGYGLNRPYFIAEYKSFRQLIRANATFSNGLQLKIINGDNFWVIDLGKILETGNLEVTLNHV
jgi:hypothetical protein